MYFFVSIRFYIRYFYDFPLSLYVHEKKLFYEKVSKYHYLVRYPYKHLIYCTIQE